MKILNMTVEFTAGSDIESCISQCREKLQELDVVDGISFKFNGVLVQVTKEVSDFNLGFNYRRGLKELYTQITDISDGGEW